MTHREALRQELLDELAAHMPPRFMKHLRRWPSGPLSLVHLHVLAVLDETGSLPMGELAESLDVSQASATGIVDRMEQRGLVERRRDGGDRRVIRVAQTPAGRELIAAIAAERAGHLATMLDELTDDELAALLVGTRALHRVRDRLHAAQDDPDAAPNPTPNADPDPGAAAVHPTAVVATAEPSVATR